MATLKKIVNKKLGEILEDAGYLKSEDIESALKIQKSSGVRFGEVLVKEGYCSEENIIRALVNQLNAPFLDIVGYKVNEDLIKKVSYETAISAGLVPLDQIGEIVLVAITAPINMDTYTELEKALGGSLHLCIADSNQVKNKINIAYPEELKSTIKRSNTVVVSAQEHALQMQAKEQDVAIEETPKSTTSSEEDEGMTGLGNLLLGD